MTARSGPVPATLVDEVADRHDVASDALGTALDRIHDDLHEGADAIHVYYTGSNPDVPAYGADLDAQTVPEPVTGAAGLVTVVWVDDATWDGLTDRFDLSDELAAAVRAVHATHAGDVAPETVSDDTATSLAPLVLPSLRVATLVRAGLSHQQGAVQTLREQGFTQADIAGRLGIDVGTVKSHCYRIDEKVRDARRLLEVLGDATDREQ
ncbi:sigma factor-like helix-turn-helix DNA-binding protein [Haloarchaeobius amylolyticus]|uniref:sigma factor-like helix-turn-helix DNA-binding protein n=1 Tax=Haloarchaeobius amylolyticus TaxID=1198296 RepID=UPI00226FBC5A|nr:sigma factor-like helix-turn-helix DNA-binding protein [Haloarchaeobius amylolyticus]